MRKAIENPSDYLSEVGTPIIDVINRINSVEGLFQLVIDGSGAFVGTVTDGDVRRALLDKAALDDPIDRYVFRKAVTAHVRMTEDQIDALLLKIDFARPFLPVLDAEKRVERIVFGTKTAPTQPDFAALVMAGGRGTRLGERTRTTPKPLLEVGGKPMIERVLCSLEDANVSRVMISVHYLADKIRNFVESRQSKCPITLLEEDSPLGTAGAIGLAPKFEQLPLLVMNADVLTDLDIQSMLAFHRRHLHDMTIAVTVHEFNIPFGVIDMDSAGLFRAIREKPKVSNFVASGVYLLEPAVKGLLKPNVRTEMPDLLQQAHAMGFRIGLYPVHEYWTDLGLPEQLEAADRAISDSK